MGRIGDQVVQGAYRGLQTLHEGIQSVDQAANLLGYWRIYGLQVVVRALPKRGLQFRQGGEGTAYSQTGNHQCQQNQAR